MRNSSFWGVLLFIIIFMLIARPLFYFSLKLVGIIAVFGFIYWIVSMVRQKSNSGEGIGSSEDVVFSNRDIVATNAKDKYDIVFGNATLDLTTLPIPVEKRTIKIDTVFGNSVVKINPEVPAVIKVGSVFASAQLPNGVNTSFGDYMYTTRSYREGAPHLYIKADVVFGYMRIVE